MNPTILQEQVESTLRVIIPVMTSPTVSDEIKAALVRDAAAELIQTMLEHNTSVLDVEQAALYVNALHVYKVEGMSDAQVRTNAVRERKMHGPATLVVQHLHDMSQPCNEKCKAKTFDLEED